MSRKKSKKEYYQESLNEIGDFRADEMRELMKLNYKIKCKFKSRKQKEMSDLIKKNRITFVTGSPGTGKSFVALKTGLELLKNSEVKIGDILLTTPIIEVSSKSIGALPGDLDMKVQNYFQHFYDNIEKIIDKKTLTFLKSSGLITDKIVNFMRGATFGKSDEDGNPIGTFCILDECFTGDSKVVVNFNKKSGRGYNYKSIRNIYKDFNKGKEITVPSYNLEKNKIEYKKVTNVFKNLDRDIKNIYMELSKNPIKTTKNHPFSVFGNGEIIWKKVEDLKSGDMVLRYKNSDSNNATILFKDSYDILLGFMLGDGCILRNKQKTSLYRLSKTHGLKQKDYMLFCKEIFNGTVERKGLKSGYTGKPLCGFTTKSLIIDTNFLKLVKNNCDGKKYICEGIDRYFTLRTLSLWYMDDGYYHKEAKHIYMNTQGFCDEEVMILSDILKSKFNLKNSIDKRDSRKGDGKKYNLIRIHKESSERMLNLIKDLLHPSMLYKSEFSENNFDKESYRIENSDNLTVSYVKNIEDGTKEDTYNFEVEDNNNYFVNKFLVHNCQNLTQMELKTYISRLGENSKMVILGDIEQCDIRTRKGEKNALADAIERFKDIDGVGIIEFGEDDIVRDKFLIEIMKRYNN